MEGVVCEAFNGEGVAVGGNEVVLVIVETYQPSRGGAFLRPRECGGGAASGGVTGQVGGRGEAWRAVDGMGDGIFQRAGTREDEVAVVVVDGIDAALGTAGFLPRELDLPAVANS